MNSVSVISSGSATIESPAVLVYSDILNFDLSQCNTIEDVVSNISYMFGSVNRASLYSAYVVGKLVDPVVLERKFGIPTIAALAKILGCSANTLIRYRTVSESLTPAQVEQLANRRVSINAVLALSDSKKDHPEETEAVMDMLLTGCDIKTESEVQQAIFNKIVEKVKPYNLLPGSEPEALEGHLIAPSKESTETVADQFIEASHNPILDVEDDGEDEDEGDYSAPSNSSDSSDGGSLNTKEIKTVLKTVRTWIAAAKRDVISVHDIKDKLDAILDSDSMILGDDEMYESYADLMEQLYSNILTAAEAIIPEVKRGIEYGYIKRGILLPQTADVETLFRKES